MKKTLLAVLVLCTGLLAQSFTVPMVYRGVAIVVNPISVFSGNDSLIDGNSDAGFSVPITHTTGTGTDTIVIIGNCLTNSGLSCGITFPGSIGGVSVDWTSLSSVCHFDYYGGSNYGCAYYPNVASGVNSIVFPGQSCSPGDGSMCNINVKVFSLYKSSGGAPVLDATNSATSTNCTSCVAPTITVHGTDIVLQFFEINGSGRTVSINGAYSSNMATMPTGMQSLFSYATGITSYTAPTWSVSPYAQTYRDVWAFQ